MWLVHPTLTTTTLAAAVAASRTSICSGGSCSRLQWLQQRRCFSSNTAHPRGNTDSSNDNNHREAMGTVKFYLRDKGYGFVVADGRGDKDYFLHRSAIRCSTEIPAHVLASTVKYPYLKKDERVRFTIQRVSSGLEKAVDVTWLNGTPIPPERTNFLGGVHERAKHRLGERVYDLCRHPNDASRSASTNNDTDENQPFDQQVRRAFAAAERTIASAETLVQELGMKVTDFPIIKASVGRGRYLFEHEVVAGSEVGREGGTQSHEEHDHYEYVDNAEKGNLSSSSTSNIGSDASWNPSQSAEKEDDNHVSATIPKEPTATTSALDDVETATSAEAAATPDELPSFPAESSSSEIDSQLPT